jgi:hypothetical protein
MYADAKFDPPFRRQARVALDHAVLDFDGTAHRVDHAAELDDRPVAGALDDAAMMSGGGGVDEIAAQPPKTRKRPVLIGARKARVANDIRNQDRGELSGLAYWRPSG